MADSDSDSFVVMIRVWFDSPSSVQTQGHFVMDGYIHKTTQQAKCGQLIHPQLFGACCARLTAQEWHTLHGSVCTKVDNNLKRAAAPVSG